jgi:hypothetical protein
MPNFGHLTIYSSPRVVLVHLAADAIPFRLCITGQEAPQLLVRLGDCLVVSLLGFLEHLLSLLNLHLAGLNINYRQDSVSRSRGFKEILQRLRPLFNSLGEHPTPLAQPFLINDLEDCNNVCKVFLVVSTGVNGHAAVGCDRKLDLENLRFLLGRDDVHLRYIRDGRPVAQLPFLALSILQPVGRLEGGTHFGVLPESSTKQEFLERTLRQNLLEPSCLNGGLKICRMHKFLGPIKKTCLCRFRTYDRLDGLVQEIFGLSLNALLELSRVLNSKCPKH